MKVVRVETTAHLQEHVLEACASADAVVMAAAPADFRPVDQATAKIKNATRDRLLLRGKFVGKRIAVKVKAITSDQKLSKKIVAGKVKR